MVVSYYIKLLRTKTDRHNGILMSLLRLTAETKSFETNSKSRIINLGKICFGTLILLVMLLWG